MLRQRLQAMGCGVALLLLGGCSDGTTEVAPTGTTGSTGTSASSDGVDGTTAVGTTEAATHGGGSADVTGPGTTTSGSTSTGLVTDTDADTETDTDPGIPPECVIDADCDDMLLCSGVET